LICLQSVNLKGTNLLHAAWSNHGNLRQDC